MVICSSKVAFLIANSWLHHEGPIKLLNSDNLPSLAVPFISYTKLIFGNCLHNFQMEKTIPMAILRISSFYDSNVR